MPENLIKSTIKDGRSLTIAPANPDEAEQMLAFATEMFKSSPYVLTTAEEFSYTVEQEKQILQKHLETKGLIFLAGKIDGEIVACTNAGCGQRKRNSHVANLGTSVGEKFRGIGVGEAMMTALIKWAKENNQVEYLRLNVMSANAPAIGLYSKLGFEKVGLEKNAFKYSDGSYQDNITMILEI